MSESLQQHAEQQAIEWQAQLSSDLATEQQTSDFNRWLQECPENAIAWRAVNDFWTGLDRLTLADMGCESAKPIPLVQKTRAIKPKRPYLKATLALAASLLLMLRIAYPELGYYLADYRTLTGQQQQITLSDGSSILLNTHSAVSVDFSVGQRLMTLDQGEAYFKVAKDPGRPFVVKTEAGTVQALGTAFDVKESGQAVSVTVFEHAVKVTTASGEVKENLVEGEGLEFSAAHLNAASPVNLQRASAWQHQRIVFQDKPLSEVASELERYRPGKIIILSESIKSLPITGVFGIEDTDIALQSIEQSLPVKVLKLTEKLVLLSAK